MSRRSMDSTSSSSEGEEEEEVVLRDEDKISMSKAFPRPAAAAGAVSSSGASASAPGIVEEERGDGYADPQSPGGSSNIGDAGNAQQSPSEVSVSEGESSSSEGVLVERPINPDRDSRCLQVDPDSGILVNFDGSMQEGDREVEDSGKEDNFVDAPEQLGFSEVRSSSGLGESMAVIEIAQSSREKALEDEVARLAAQFERTSNECRKYKEEVEICREDITSLHQMLQAVVEGQSGPVSDDKIKAEEDKDDRHLMPSAPLNVMVNDCSKLASLLKTNIRKLSQSDGRIKELNVIVNAKDEEIEELNIKVSENSLSQDVALSYWTSLREMWLESLKQATDRTAERLLSSLRTVLPLDDEYSGDSVVDGTSLIEKRTIMLIEKHSHIISEIEQLGQCLAAVRSDFVMPQQNELGNVFDAARREFLEGKSKETYFLETINELKKEKDEILEQLDQAKHDLEEAKVETSKTKAELELAENKFVAVREKLSMAVTKGKSLVQHRDSLKQSLAEKASELEKCLLELQQQSDALEATKASLEELSKSQILVVSLQGSLSQQNKILHEIEDAVSQIDFPTDLQPVEVVDRVRWLVDQKQNAEGVLLESRKLKGALSSFDLPESVSSSDLEYQMHWLLESFTHRKDYINRLESELANAQAAAVSCESQLLEAHKEIDMLTLSVSEGKQVIASLHIAHEDLMYKYEEVVEKFSRTSFEKNQLMRALLEVSESTTDYQPPNELDKVIEECLEKVKSWKNTVLESSCAELEQFQRLQILLYTRNQDLVLSENILEEEMLDRTVLVNLSNELNQVSEEVKALRNERDSLQKDFDRVEEKCSMLREKLSMAVKKGKGLVQEREGFKLSLDEKNSEIQKLKSDLQLQESAVVELKEQIKNLTAELEHTLQLEANIVSLKEERDQINQYLQDSNNSLQRVTDAIDCIPLPNSMTSEGPIEKLKKIAYYFDEIEVAKASAEQALENTKAEALAQATKLSDACASIRSLEDSLSQMEKNIVITIEEKEEAKLEKLHVEQELEKVKEEAGSIAVELAQSHATIKNLQDALSQVQNSISILTDEKNGVESRCTQEIVSLNAKLAMCMEELSGTRGSLENQSSELFSHLQHLQMLMRDKGLLFLMAEGFKRKVDGLKNLGLLVQNIHDKFAARGLEGHPDSEQDAYLRRLLSLPQLEEYADGKIFSIDSRTLDAGEDIPSFSKVVESAGNQMKHTTDSFKDFSAYVDEHIALLLQALQATLNKVDDLLEHRERLVLDVRKLEADNQAQELKMTKLQNNMSMLLSACKKSIQDLQIEFHDILDMEFIANYKRDDSTFSPVSRENDDDDGVEEQVRDADEYHVAAAELLATARRIKSKTQQFASVKGMWIMATNDLKKKFREAELAAETAIQDRNAEHEMVLKLEANVDELQSSVKDMKLRMEDYQAIDAVLRDKEAEISLLHHTLAEKETEEGKKLFLEGQLEQLFGKIAMIEIPFKELEVNVEEYNFQNPMDKFFYVVDNVFKLQHMIKSMAHEKEEIQLILADKFQELEQFRKDSENYVSINEDLENRKHDLTELSTGLEKVIQKLAGYDFFETKKPADVKGLFQVLERLVVASIQDSESLKSRVQELGTKLQASQTLNEELSSNIKLLQGSIHARPPLPDVKERSILEASSAVTGPEISEIEEGGSVGKRSVSPAPVAAHVRTTRKGSSEHLALNIDPESEQLISPHEIDDKGHVFKSLNTSGLIPKQGKHIADRIDGIWVSGGRMLMSRPGARIGLIAYWLLLHLWVLGTIL